MGEITSVGITGSNGQNAGYAYYSGKKYLGSGARKLTRSEQLGRAGTSKMDQAIRTAGARQAARTSRAFGNIR